MPPVPGRALAHADAVTSVSLSADAKRLITGGADKLVRAWNLTNNQMERQFAGHGRDGGGTQSKRAGAASGGADETFASGTSRTASKPTFSDRTPGR
jgi:WD40 repeat protein